MPINNSSEKDRTNSVFQNLSKPQKIAVVVLAIIAIAIVIFWISQFKSQLTRPFPSGRVTTEDELVNYLDPQQRDTDKDGISDYDEVNIFGTSIYLEDSDSDGILDRVEIEQGTDPLCPAGQECNNFQEELPINNTIDDQIQNNLIPPENINSTNVDEAYLQEAMSGQSDAATLRLILIQSGADSTMIESISDEDLMKIYQESLNNQNE